jgi:hypothetical protein
MSEPETLSYESPQTPLSGIGIGTIALQIVGLYCIVLAVPMVTMLASFAGMSGGGVRGTLQLVFSVVPFAVYIVLGVLLIRFAPRLSTWLFRGVVGGVMTGPITAPAGKYLQAIAFSVVGVMTMIDAAPRIVSLIYFASMGFGGRDEGYSMLVEPIMQFLVGLALFLQSRGLSMLWHKIRTGGVVPSASASVHTDTDRA